ncbi:MAG TPA: hypothetical protein VJR04_03270, partial [Terriglobales bacterium]|nr:hypothetical protein [Terriglobales bacterium]
MRKIFDVCSSFILALVLAFSILTVAAPALAQQDRLQSSDLSRFRDVGEVALSPNGKMIAYTVINFDRPGRPYPQLWVLDVASGKSARLGGENEVTSDAVWSPDGRWIAYSGEAEGKSGLVISHPDGSEKTFLAETEGTNSPLPGQGNDVTWSPDGKEIAFISATPGPETAAAGGDPMVFT